MTAMALAMTERIRTAASLGESHFREFKSGLEGHPDAKVPREVSSIRRDVAEALIAFANADGGEILVGVEDDGRITGLPHEAERLEMILQSPEDLVHPDTPLSGVARSLVDIDGMAVAYFSVSKSSTFVHQLSDGRCVRRRDLETVPAVAATLTSEREEEVSRSYDRAYVDGASVGDLNSDLLSKSASVISAGSSSEMLLQQMGLADFSQGALRLRRAALLLFAADIDRWHPRCAVRIMQVDGPTLQTGANYNVVKDSTVSGSIVELIPTAWDLIRAYLSRTTLTERGRFEESVLFPEDACLEAVVNALAHRSYAIEGRLTEIYVYPDRLEVSSPGSVLQTVSIHDLRSGGGVHESRNTLVARVLRELGFMREIGEGVRRMFDLMRERDLVDPDFDVIDDTFKVTLANRSTYDPEALKWIDGYRSYQLNREEQRVVLFCSHGKPVSPVAIMEMLGVVDSDDYRRIYSGLQKKGLAYSSLSKQGVAMRAKKKRLSARHVERVLVLPPTDAQQQYDDLLGALRSASSSFPLNRRSVGDVRVRLRSDSPFGSSDGSLMSSLRQLDLIDSTGQPSPRLREDFSAYGVDYALDSSQAKRAEAMIDSEIVIADASEAAQLFDELYAAAEALGVELTLQTAGNRLRRLVGPDGYASMLAGSGLRTFVETTGRYTIADDHGRHVVRRLQEGST